MLAKIRKQNGNRVFEIDGKTYIPAAFRSFRPTPANVSLFYRSGIRLFQMQCSGMNSTLGLPYSNYGAAWVGDHRYDFAALDRQMEMFMKFAPEGYFMLMVQLDMPDWWRKENDCPWNSYTQLGEALFVEKWVSDACDYLQAFIRYAEEKYGDRVFAYSFSAGCATEWFDQWYYDGVSEEKAADYRAKTGDPTAPVPTMEEIRSTAFPSLREDDNAVYRYQKYCAGLIPDLILRFAGCAQEVLHHQKILGLFFGYTDQPVHWQNQTGTNGYEKVWASPDIDMLFSPAAYQTRKLNQVSSYQYTVDSIALHDKLYLHEIDHRTYLAQYPMDNFGMIYTEYQNEEETITVLRRELCATAVKGGSLWWFDFMGGYYASPGLEKELQTEMHVLEKLYAKPHRSVSEIAVFVDPMSFLRMHDETSMPHDLVWHNRDSLHNCGAPYDYFNLKDIARLDLTQYKMCVFLNAVEIPEEIQEIIRTGLTEQTKVWVYAPCRATGGMEKVCSVKLREIELPEGKVQYGSELFGFTDPTSPMFAVDDPEAEILASYTDGTPACGRKGKDVYISAGNVPAVLWQDLARAAGVHIYSDTPGALYADSRFVARQTVWEQDITIHMPFDCRVEELFSGKVYATENRELRYTAAGGETNLFMILED